MINCLLNLRLKKNKVQIGERKRKQKEVPVCVEDFLVVLRQIWNPYIIHLPPTYLLRLRLRLRLRLQLCWEEAVVHLIGGLSMALEWVVLGYAAGAEAIMLVLLTIPGLDALRKGLITVTRNLLKPFMSIVPFCLFLLMDIYWKYETRPTCESDSCSPSEHLRHQKSIMKSQRNALLIASALIFYWLLYSVTTLVVRVEQLNKRIEKLRNQDWLVWWVGSVNFQIGLAPFLVPVCYVEYDMFTHLGYFPLLLVQFWNAYFVNYNHVIW